LKFFERKFIIDKIFESKQFKKILEKYVKIILAKTIHMPIFNKMF